MGTKLELADLHHRFGATPVLGGLDLRLEAGEIGCLLGPSGCGKTTVLRLIAGLESVQRGEVRIDGTTVAAPGADLAPEKRRVGMVFQDHALFPHLDVLGNVSFGLAHLPDARRREIARDYLARVGLADAGDRYPHQLSGGQRQRVALARALAPEPRLILLDEPFASLDVELRERLGLEVRELLRSCQATALLVTHDQQEAFAIADRIGVLAHGRIHQWDLAYNLYHRPVDRFVADFVGQGVLLDGVVEADGSIRVELGRLPGQPITEFPPDSRVEVLLRPDDLIHDDASPLTARIVRKVFRGAEILYTLELPSRARVLSLVPSHHNHQVGEAIGIRLATDHVVAFARCD